MKKLFVIIISVVCFAGLFGCGKQIKYSDSNIGEVNDFPNVSMQLKDETVTKGMLTLKLINNNDFDIESGNGNDFEIEAFRAGKWQVIEIGERDNTAEACLFYKGAHLIQVGVSAIYGDLPNGHYRVIKCFWPAEVVGVFSESDKFYLSAEFDIE